MSTVVATKATATATSGNNITITKPTGLAAGDMLVAIIAATHDATNGSFDPPGGWTTLEDVGETSSNGYVGAFAKVADSGDAAASNFTFTAVDNVFASVGTLFRITGTNGFASPTINIISDGTTTLPGSGLTTLQTNYLLLLAGIVQDSPDYNMSGYSVANNDPTWTEEYDLTSGVGTLINLGVASATYANAQATGNYDVSGNGFKGLLIAITENRDNTFNTSPLTLTATQPNPSVTGDANFTHNPLALTTTLPTATITAQQNTVWTNEDGAPDTTWTLENF